MMKKYEVTGKKLKWNGRKLHQIKAITDLAIA